MSGVCGTCGCDPCAKECPKNCCNNACLRWGFDGCYLRGRCADGTELTPLDLCAWLKVHETCTELLLVPDASGGSQNGGYMLYRNECGEEYKFWVCDFLNLASIRCLNDVWDYPDPDGDDPERAKPCDIMVFDPDCDRDPTNPKHNKWVPYHIPDAGDCVITPDADGYSRVLIKDDCGCIRECKLFIQPNTYEYFIRDSWPDDPDEPFHPGTRSEVIDLKLDEKIPIWGATDLEVTVQYGFGIQNHRGYGGERNFKSTVVPTNEPTTTPSMASVFSNAFVVQGCNLLPWGSWEWQVTRTFIVPKGQKAYLSHNVEVRDINTNLIYPSEAEKNIAQSRLHALRVVVRATKGVKV